MTLCRAWESASWTSTLLYHHTALHTCVQAVWETKGMPFQADWNPCYGDLLKLECRSGTNKTWEAQGTRPHLKLQQPASYMADGGGDDMGV